MKHRYSAVIPFSIILSIFIIFSCTTPAEQPAETAVEKPSESAVERPDRENEAYVNIERMISEGDTESAVDEFEKVKDDSSDTVLAYAGLLMAAGEYLKAEQELTALIEREPMNADAYFNLALVKGLQGEQDSEMAFLEKAIAADPEHSQALSVTGSIYLSESKLKKASEMFERALDTDPDNIIALTGYGSTLIREEEYEKAEAILIVR